MNSGRLPGPIAARPPGQRLALGYAGLVLGPTAGIQLARWADFRPGLPFALTVVAYGLMYGGVVLYATALSNLFQREYGQSQRALVSWVNVSVSMLAVVALGGQDLLLGVIVVAAFAGGSTWYITGLIVRRHVATLPPPPGATMPSDPGTWSPSSLRPPRQ